MTRFEILHSESSCGWGGQELRVIDEARGFLREGHGVTLVAPAESRIVVEARSRGVPVVALPIARRSVAALRALRAHIASRRIDIVNSHSSTDSWLSAIALQTLREGPKLVRTRHVSAPIPGNWPTRWLYRRAADHVVTTGEALRLQVIREAGVRESRVTSVPTGLDLARFSPGDQRAARAELGIADDKFVVGVVATLRSWKGHRYLVEAFAAQARENWQLLIVGGGPGEENLRRQVSELGIEKKVLMPGNQSDVLPWLRAMDAFALPSYANEGVPQAIMQAQACGIPVVSTAVGSITELIADNETGLLVTPKDVDSLGAAIVRLAGDEALRRRLADAAHQQALQRYSDRLMIERMTAVFRSVMAARAS